MFMNIYLHIKEDTTMTCLKQDTGEEHETVFTRPCADKLYAYPNLRETMCFRKGIDGQSMTEKNRLFIKTFCA